MKPIPVTMLSGFLGAGEPCCLTLPTLCSSHCRLRCCPPSPNTPAADYLRAPPAYLPLSLRFSPGLVPTAAMLLLLNLQGRPLCCATCFRTQT